MPLRLACLVESQLVEVGSGFAESQIRYSCSRIYHVYYYDYEVVRIHCRKEINNIKLILGFIEGRICPYVPISIINNCFS